MRPGYLDQYGAGEDRRNKIIFRSVAGALIVIIVSAFSWYLLKNRHQEGVVKDFLAAVRRGDLPRAYRIWGCTEQKPCSGYGFERFSGDWGQKAPSAAAANEGGPPDLSMLALTDSESCNNGVLLTVEVNRARTEKLWIDKTNDAINFAPYPTCPHKNPWAIMLHRTIGKLKKPLLQ